MRKCLQKNNNSEYFLCKLVCFEIKIAKMPKTHFREILISETSLDALRRYVILLATEGSVCAVCVFSSSVQNPTKHSPHIKSQKNLSPTSSLSPHASNIIVEKRGRRKKAPSLSLKNQTAFFLLLVASLMLAPFSGVKRK